MTVSRKFVLSVSTLAVIAVGALLVGCAPEQRAPKTQSHETLELAASIASKLAGARAIRVQDTGSMEPALDGSMAVIVVPRTSYTVGDMIAYSYDDRLILHRVKEIDAYGRVWTKGDALDKRDAFWVSQSDIIGKIVVVVSM